jgi:hypothetical protein
MCQFAQEIIKKILKICLSAYIQIVFWNIIKIWFSIVKDNKMRHWRKWTFFKEFCMKNRLSLAGIIIILVFGIMGTGCDNPISISGGNGEYHEPPPEMDFFTYRVYPYPGAAKPETVTKITYEIAKQDYTTEWITLENVSIAWEKSVY